MAYQSGQVIEANGTLLNDFNELAALINEIFGDTHAGDFNPVTGLFGYGQSPEVAPVSVGEVITAAQWTSLFETLHRCADHQGTADGGLVTGVSVGELIDAFDNPNQLIDLINLVINNKLNINPVEAQITSGGSQLTESRTSPWTVAVTHEFDVVFASGDQARHFFNSGGEIHWSGEYIPGTPNESGEESEWQSVFNSIGTLTFGHSNAVASSGTTYGGGYYGLTTVYQPLLQKSIGGTSYDYYATESVLVEARTLSASNDTIRFKVSFITDGGFGSDRVLNGILSSKVDQKKSVNNVIGPQPTYVNVQPASSGQELPGS